MFGRNPEVTTTGWRMLIDTLDSAFAHDNSDDTREFIALVKDAALCHTAAMVQPHPVSMFCDRGDCEKCSHEGHGVVYTTDGKRTCTHTCHPVTWDHVCPPMPYTMPFANGSRTFQRCPFLGRHLTEDQLLEQRVEALISA